MQPLRYEHPVDFEASPEDESPLGLALGDGFKVFLPYRARKVEVICRRCLTRWCLPKNAMASPREWLFIRGHADDCPGWDARLLAGLDNDA